MNATLTQVPTPSTWPEAVEHQQIGDRTGGNRMIGTGVRLLSSTLLAGNLSDYLSNEKAKTAMTASIGTSTMGRYAWLVLALVLREFFLSFKVPLISNCMVLLCSLEVRSTLLLRTFAL